MKQCDGQINLFDILSRQVVQEEQNLRVQVVSQNDKPICQFSGHTCNKEAVWEVADTLDDKADCPHTCCRKCDVKGCGARCSGSEEPKLKPGDWVEEDLLGDRLTFEEITQEVGNLIIIDKSTQSHAWYKVVLVEKIITHGNDTRSLYYYDGVKQRGMIGEQYFEEGRYQYTAKAWGIKR